jgi:c(7)-type cytochrome triheme protein
MKDEKRGLSSKGGGGVIIFFVGFVLALIFGWVVFPNLLFSQKTQPLNFSHAAHQDSACDDCHFYREDGSYTGIPKLEKCAECHESPMGETEAERTLVEEYIQKEREIPWLVYSWQPDNVYFSHAPHKAKEIKCVECHRDVSEEKQLPSFKKNRVTSYSMATMQMDVCEKCHVRMGAKNNCQSCHK